jgi:murein DD-endopeptidase MepM/ murein hydrolase activator NlpD
MAWWCVVRLFAKRPRSRRGGTISTPDTNESRLAREEGRPPSAPADALELPPWIAADPPAVSRRPPMRRTPRRRAAARERSRARAIAGCAVLGTIVTGVASLIGGLPLTPPGTGDEARGRAVALASNANGAKGDPSSFAITADAGPFHPVRSEGKIDYGDAGARFGASRYGHSHEGQDMFAKSGTPLIAVRDGVVVDKGNDGGRGNYIGIHSPSEDQTYVYFHMLRPTSLKRGDRVAAGAKVGSMGCTGSCYGTHLHFEIRRGDEIEDKPIDPLPLLKRWPQSPQ